MIRKALITLSLLCLSVTVFAYDFSAVAPTGQTLYYTIISGATVSVSGGYNIYGDLTIPSSVTNNGTTYTVTTIGSQAFNCNQGLTSVNIPNSVTTIEQSAFLACSGLTSLTIPNSVTFIGVYAFTECSGLQSIVVSSGNTVYDSRNNCNALIETSTNTLIIGCNNSFIPNTVAVIGYAAFYGCTGLTSVTIPNSVVSINNSVFAGCTGLTSINIPSSVSYFGYSVFSGCTGLTSITVESGNTNYDSRNNCNAIIESWSNKLIAGCQSTTIPNTVTTIGNGAFNGCSTLTSITIPTSVTTIETYAFNGVSLTSLAIPNSVTLIEVAAIQSPSLTSLTVASGNTHYDSRDNSNAIIETDSNKLIIGCKSTIIPNTIVHIGNHAFSSCPGLTSITIPHSVTTIGVNAFAGCPDLTFLVIPNSVTSVAPWAFIDIDTIVYCGDDPNCPWGAYYYYCDPCLVTPDPEIQSIIYDTILLGETYSFPDLQIIGAGDYHRTHTYSSDFGCDSIVTLHLTVLDTVVYMPDTVFHPQVTVSIGTLYNWQGNAYGTMHVESADLSMGRVIGGDGYYKNGDIMQIYAFPQNGYRFDKWSDGVVQNPRSIAVSSSTYDIVYMAEFVPIDASNQQPAENNDGAETTSPKRNYPVDCGNNYLTIQNISQYNGYGQRIVTTHVFDTLLLCFDTVDLDDNALFKSFIVMSANNSRGQVIGGDGCYLIWQQTRIAAVPYQGYEFQRWGDNNTDNPRYVTMNEETQNKIYMAYFVNPNGIDEISGGVKVYTQNGDVVIEGADGRSITVFDMLGRQLFNSKITNSNYIIHNTKFPASGLYLVKVDGVPLTKIAVVR
ncbi:MAG: leucine-rich repeat protein [Bacteroidales bacterium]|nr:leucine-rich repeat protein [Bacteroidales bacterium]